MAAASDKVRFFQEQYVPELQEFARKKIFTKDEIASIARTRSNFEHVLDTRGSKPQDYARYAAYEMNLESLREKRVKKLGAKTSKHASQRRIFFVLDRATKKFPGDVRLWMQYITFAEKQKSKKQASHLLTSLLRLHPTKPELWVYAATMIGANIRVARSYMHRGLRLCGSSAKLWIEYARLEMVHISRIVGRSWILDLHGGKAKGKSRQNSCANLPTTASQGTMPAQPLEDGARLETLENLGASPALSGAIPMAIFDAAMKHFKKSDQFCQQFFDMIAEFREAPCLQSILTHTMDTLRLIAPQSPATLIRWIQQPVIGIDVATPEFPALFGLCLDHMKQSFETLATIDTTQEITRPTRILIQHIVSWMLSYEKEDLDADVHKVIMATTRKLESMSRRL